jgi:hypothetical protein
MLIGLANNPNLSRTANYTDRVSGVGSSKTVSVTFPSAGTNYIEFAYAKDGSSFSGGDYGMYRVASGSVVWVSTSIVEKNAAGEWEAKSWSDPVQWTGTSGKDGNDGRIFSYTGEYSSSKSYTGDSRVAQVVKVGLTYYYTTANAGTFSGVTPPNSAYWTIFGANFESVATDILFAKNGTLGSFTFDFATKEFRSAETDGIPTAKYPLGTPNIVLNSETGEAIFNKLESISGTFKRLNCVDDNGNTVGGISFSSSGEMTFSGDLYHQGFNSAKNRSYRFYTSNMWCRGAFGARSRNTMVVYGASAYYYPDGISNTTTRVSVSLTSEVGTNGQRFYYIPLYGTISEASGFPVDLVIFATASSYYYTMSGSIGKTVKVVNAHNGNNGIYIYSNGNAVQLSGGCAGELMNINGFLNPALDSRIVGLGWLFVSFYDNNWS